jgi:aryl-alcohol dehydrogenase-like predicted oxidoreductase
LRRLGTDHIDVYYAHFRAGARETARKTLKPDGEVADDRTSWISRPRVQLDLAPPRAHPVERPDEFAERWVEVSECCVVEDDMPAPHDLSDAALGTPRRIG